MDLSRNYQNCFWTASGDLDCQSQNKTGGSATNWDHSSHIPSSGTMFTTHSPPQLNQNLGFIPRSCSLPNSSRNPCSSGNGAGFGAAGRLTNFNMPRSAQIDVYRDNMRTSLGGRGVIHHPAQSCTSQYNQLSPYQFKPLGNTPTYQASDPMGLGHQFEQIGAGSGGLDYTGQPKEMHTTSLIAYKAPLLMRELGQPDVLDPSNGGIALWKESSLADKLSGIYKRVELHDEKVPNLNPVPFIGNVYTWTKINLRSDLFRDLLDLFPNIWYDRQKRWLTIRTDSLDNNLGVLAIICMINRGTISIRQVRHYDLQRKYLLSLCPTSRKYNKYCKATFINIIKHCVLR